MQNYVVGLMFNTQKTKVVLLEKKHGPDCVIDKWNGVGGKVEQDELPVRAMVREFVEETGLLTEAYGWKQFCILKSDVHRVIFYYMFSSDLKHVKTVTDELVVVTPVERALTMPNIMDNLRWMIPFILDPNINDHNLGTLGMKRED